MRFSPRLLVDAYLRQITKKRIIGGPFLGLYYVKESLESSYFPKLLGIYEKELHEIIKSNQTEHFDKIVVIGAGEGYYAVGLAKKWKRPVLAFEKEEKGRQLITRLSLINRVTVFVKAEFTSEIDTQSGKDFIFMDVEGAERELMTIERFLEWQRSVIVLEVHSEPTKGLMIERGKYTHHSTFIPVAAREMADYPFSPPFARLLKRWWWAAIQEWRSDSIGWVIFDPKQ